MSSSVITLGQSLTEESGRAPGTAHGARAGAMTRCFRHRAALALALAFTAAMASTGAAAGVPSMRATETDSITITPRGVCATA